MLRRIGVCLTAAVLLVLVTSSAAFGVDRAYWANGNNTLSYANLDGGGGAVLNIAGATANGARGVDVDPVTGRIYWANQGNDTISYANLDGSGGGGELNTAGATVDRPHGVAIDHERRRILWANDTTNPVSWARLDGSGGGDLDTTGATHAEPYGIVIDAAAEKVYWANRVTNTISYANLDGSGGGGELDVTGAPINKPHGVTIDPTAGKIYWANLGNTIGFANTDGSGGGAQLDLTGGDPRGPVGMAIDPTAGRLYWANLGGDWSIPYVALDGSGVGGRLDITGAQSTQPRFLALVQTPRTGGAPPAISGERALGSVLSCSAPWLPDMPDGFLYRAPLDVEYQWSRDGVDIAGASSVVYTAFAAGTYRCRVTASNRAGETVLTSTPHTVTAPAPAVATAAAVAPAAALAPAALPPAPASFAGSKSSITVNRRGGFVFTFRAVEGLTGSATFESLGKRRATLAQRWFTVRRGSEVTVGGRLSKANFRALKLNREISSRLTVVLRDAAGQTSTAQHTVTFEAPPQRRR